MYSCVVVFKCLKITFTNLISTDEIFGRKSNKVNWKKLYDDILCEKV